MEKYKGPNVGLAIFFRPYNPLPQDFHTKQDERTIWTQENGVRRDATTERQRQLIVSIGLE
jgi:hypothetical protein